MRWVEESEGGSFSVRMLEVIDYVGGGKTALIGEAGASVV